MFGSFNPTPQPQESRKDFAKIRHEGEAIVFDMSSAKQILGALAAALLAGTLMTAGPAQADTTQPALSHFNPQLPPFSLTPMSDAEELQRQIADLDAAWDSISPAERQQRIAGGGRAAAPGGGNRDNR